MTTHLEWVSASSAKPEIISPAELAERVNTMSNSITIEYGLHEEGNFETFTARVSTADGRERNLRTGHESLFPKPKEILKWLREENPVGYRYKLDAHYETELVCKHVGAGNKWNGWAVPHPTDSELFSFITRLRQEIGWQDASEISQVLWEYYGDDDRKDFDEPIPSVTGITWIEVK